MTDTKSCVFRFEDFEVNEDEFLVIKAGQPLSVEPKAFRVLLVLLRNPQKLITKEELLDAVWNDCNVSENSLARAVARLRNVLGDDPREPRFIATVPTVGYRFICEVRQASETGTAESLLSGTSPTKSVGGASPAVLTESRPRISIAVARWWPALLALVVILSGVLLYLILRPRPEGTTQRTLTRLTFRDGLQIDATWSPDGRFFAYSSDQGGKFDIWVQQVSGGDPVQVTHGPGHNWQPQWSPDGRSIAYRSEAGDGGLFAVPALGGEGQRIKLSSFGFYPRWSPDSRRILFKTAMFAGENRLYIASVDSQQPVEVLSEFVTKHSGEIISANWHPDGQRISLCMSQAAIGPNIWTLRLDGTEAMHTGAPPEAIAQLGTPLRSEFVEDSGFAWSQTGDAIYFEQTLGGAKNLWKLHVDPATLEGTRLERLTASQGPDLGPEASPDGHQLLYTAASRKVETWTYPLDANSGRLLGPGSPVTVGGIENWHPSLTQDGNQLVVDALRAGKEEMWRKNLLSGEETPLFSDRYIRAFPVWSPDRRSVVYSRQDPGNQQVQLMIWSSEDSEEKPLTDLSEIQMGVTDWSADGKTLLLWEQNKANGRADIWTMPVGAALHAQSAAQKLISAPDYNLFQAHFSPDARWVAFEGIQYGSTGDRSVIYVTPSRGGPWIRVTDGKAWDDKPRWSPNGRMIYFLSARGGFLNVWASPFDPVHGIAVGSASKITSFDSPNLRVPNSISAVEISVSANKLALTVEQLSGNIWSINNVDR